MGGGSGGGRGRGGRDVKGREERNSATRTGLSQRSKVVRAVGWEGQANRCPEVWTELLQEGQGGEAPATPILALYELRKEQWPERSWDRAVRWALGRDSSSLSASGAGVWRIGFGAS